MNLKTRPFAPINPIPDGVLYEAMREAARRQDIDPDTFIGLHSMTKFKERFETEGRELLMALDPIRYGDASTASAHLLQKIKRREMLTAIDKMKPGNSLTITVRAGGDLSLSLDRRSATA